MKRARWIAALVLTALVAFAVRPEAQSVVTAQINNFWNLLKAGSTDPTTTVTYAFTNLANVAGSYINWGTVRGTSGYGIRDNSGTIEIKNSGGSWSAPVGGASPNATFLIQTANTGLPNAQVMGSLSTGLVFNTTNTGLQSIYAGTTCTNQFLSALSTAGVGTCATVALGTMVSGTLLAAQFPALTGDITTSAGALATTLATVNANVGSFGSATAIPTFTVDAKGRLTAAGSVAPQLTLTSTYFSSLSAASLTGIPGANVTGTLATAAFPALTGDVTNSAGSLATTVGKIGGNAVALGGALTFTGAFATTFTVTGATNVTLPTAGTLVSSTVASLASLSTVGTIGTGVWQGTVIDPTYGGTGINNGASTITLGGSFTTAGGVAITLTGTGGTNVTLPTTGTLLSTTNAFTWNNGATTFHAFDIAITDTASAASSTSIRMLGGGGGATVEFSVDKSGNLFSAGNHTGTVGASTLGTVTVPYSSLVLGTAATNNLSVTPSAFGAGVVATVDDPAVAAMKLPLVRRGTLAYTSGLLTTGTCSSALTATITGMTTTAAVLASLNGAPPATWQTGITFYAYPTANTVNIIVCNPTGGSITPANATFNYVAVLP